MYIYVLNFSDHSFSGHQTAVEVLDNTYRRKPL